MSISSDDNNHEHFQCNSLCTSTTRMCDDVFITIILHAYLTLRSISSLNNSPNNEMKFCEKYEVDMLKIIIIIIGYNYE
jgi:hypothetical protein